MKKRALPCPSILKRLLIINWSLAVQEAIHIKYSMGGVKNNQVVEIKSKNAKQAQLTSDCWPVQVWGLSYCSGFGSYEGMCEFLATEDCGGTNIRRLILRGIYPKTGLPATGK